MRMTGIGSLGFTRVVSEAIRRAQNGGSTMVRAGSTAAPAPARLPVSAAQSPAVNAMTTAPAARVSYGNDVISLPAPIPHLTPNRLIGRQQAPGTVRVSPTASVTSTGAGGGVGVPTAEAITGSEAPPAAKSKLPILPLALLAWLFS